MSGRAVGRSWRRAALVLVAASALSLAACADASPVAGPTASPTAPGRPTPAVAGDALALAFDPLRGTPAEAGSVQYRSAAV